jgi:hypothetical protein
LKRGRRISTRGWQDDVLLGRGIRVSYRKEGVLMRPGRMTNWTMSSSCLVQARPLEGRCSLEARHKAPSGRRFSSLGLTRGCLLEGGCPLEDYQVGFLSRTTNRVSARGLPGGCPLEDYKEGVLSRTGRRMSSLYAWQEGSPRAGGRPLEA